MLLYGYTLAFPDSNVHKYKTTISVQLVTEENICPVDLQVNKLVLILID